MFQIDEFRETGIVHLPGALTPDEALAIRRTIWNFIEARTSIKEHDPSTWPDSLPPGLSFKSLQDRAVFAPFVENDRLTEALGAIFGSNGWEPPKRRGRILLTCPTTSAWAMPAGWHMDGDFGVPAFPVPAVQLWALLDEVAPCGGGTLLLAGSHRLVDRFSADLSPDSRGGNGVTWGKFMRQDPWLNELRRGGGPDRPRRELLNDPHDVDGVQVQAIEVTGAPGDMFVSHVEVFHSTSPNNQKRMRQMLTGGITRRAMAPAPVGLGGEGA
jgi:hypothetical protein